MLKLQIKEKILLLVVVTTASLLLAFGVLGSNTGVSSTPPVVIDGTHEHSYAIKLPPASCASGENVVYQCLCGDKWVSDEVAASEHTWGEWNPVESEYVWEASSMSRKCIVCGETESKTITTANYNFDSVDYEKLLLAIESLPTGAEAMYTEESLKELSEFRERIRSYVGKLTEMQVNSAIESYNKAVDKLEYMRGDVPRIYIISDEESITHSYSEAKIAVVDSEDGDYGPVFDTNGKIKVRGNSTGEYYNVKLPYNIKFSTAENLFGMGSAKKWALLANAFDKTLIRNAIAMELGVAFELDYTSCYKFAEMWLNGKYLGSYMIIENVDVSPTRVDIDIDSGDFLIEIEYYRMETGVTYIESKYTKTRFAINDPETPTQKQLKALTDFVNTVDNAIRKKERDLIEKYIDIQSFVDVYIVEEYLKNVDFYYSSTRFYCKDGVLYAGPIWDFDLSMGNCDYYYYPDYNNIYSSGDSSKGFYGRQMPWYDILFECDWFEELVWERYNEKYSVLENVHTENELGDSLIDRIIGLYGTSFLRNFTESDSTFFTDVRLGREPNSTYEGNVYYMRSWLKRRIDWMTENLCPSHYSG